MDESQSTDCPNRTTRSLGGFTLVEWSLRLAIHAFRNEQNHYCKWRIILSTNSEEIARTGHKLGVEVLMRGIDPSGQPTNVPDAVKHTLETLKNQGNYRPDAILLLQPNNVFRLPQDIVNAFALLRKNGGSVVSLAPIPAQYHPDWAHDQTGAGYTIGTGQMAQTRTKLRPAYYRDGAIYFCTRENYEERGDVFRGHQTQDGMERVTPLQLTHPGAGDHNIKTERDWLMAMGFLIANPGFGQEYLGRAPVIAIKDVLKLAKIAMGPAIHDALTSTKAAASLAMKDIRVIMRDMHHLVTKDIPDALNRRLAKGKARHGVVSAPFPMSSISGDPSSQASSLTPQAPPHGR